MDLPLDTKDPEDGVLCWRPCSLRKGCLEVASLLLYFVGLLESSDDLELIDGSNGFEVGGVLTALTASVVPVLGVLIRLVAASALVALLLIFHYEFNS